MVLDHVLRFQVFDDDGLRLRMLCEVSGKLMCRIDSDIGYPSVDSSQQFAATLPILGVFLLAGECALSTAEPSLGMLVGLRVGVNDAVARDCKVLDTEIDTHDVLFLE